MGSLFRDRDFRLLFVGQGISEIGTAVSYVALPLIAVSALRARTGAQGRERHERPA